VMLQTRSGIKTDVGPAGVKQQVLYSNYRENSHQVFGQSKNRTYAQDVAL